MNVNELFGYVGLVVNLYSMYTKGEFKLRLFSAIANFIYIIYGMLISAMPIVIGCSIAVILHLLRLRNLITNNHADPTQSNGK